MEGEISKKESHFSLRLCMIAVSRKSPWHLQVGSYPIVPCKCQAENGFDHGGALIEVSLDLLFAGTAALAGGYQGGLECIHIHVRQEDAQGIVDFILPGVIGDHTMGERAGDLIP